MSGECGGFHKMSGTCVAQNFNETVKHCDVPRNFAEMCLFMFHVRRFLRGVFLICGLVASPCLFGQLVLSLIFMRLILFAFSILHVSMVFVLFSIV